MIKCGAKLNERQERIIGKEHESEDYDNAHFKTVDCCWPDSGDIGVLVSAFLFDLL